MHLNFGNSARFKMLQGCTLLADAVSVTLGPRGRYVIIDQTIGLPKITKDGVTVAKSIEFEDWDLNLGASLVKEVAKRTMDEAGDGTTTSTLLAKEIYRDGLRAVSAGYHPLVIRNQMIEAAE